MNCCGGHGNHDEKRDPAKQVHQHTDGAGQAEIQTDGQTDAQNPQASAEPAGHEHEGHGRGPGMLLMLLCCLLPIILIAGFLVKGGGLTGSARANGGAGFGGFSWLILLLCPLMHIFMMGRPGDKKHH